MKVKRKFKEVKVFNDEINERLQKIKNGQELPEYIADQVAGGSYGSEFSDDVSGSINDIDLGPDSDGEESNDEEGITRMWCPKCGFQCTWAGDYLHRVYECPDCPGYMYGWLYEGPGGKRV